MTRSTVRAAFSALAASLVLAGCSPGGTPLARVGAHTITANDVLDAGRGNEAQYGGTPEEAKRALLQDLVHRELLLEAARQRGLDTTSYARNYVANMRDRYALEALYAQLAPQDAGVSEAEMRRFYENRSVRVAARIIYSADPGTIRAAQDALKHGEPFGEVADRFNMAGTVPPGGVLGMVSPGQLVPPLDDALRTLPVGDIGGPYETPQGVFLLTIDSREPAEQPPYETVQSQVAEMIRQRKNRQTMSLALVRLRQEYGVALEQDAASRMFQLLTPARIGEGVMPELTPEQSAAVLATWRGGTLTVGDAFADLKNPEVAKPPAAMTPAIQQWLESRVVTRVARAEAARRHVAEDPAVARRIRRDQERYLLESMLQASVAGVPQPDEAAVRQLWDSIKDQYPQVSRANVQWVVVPDSATAAILAAYGGHGGGTLAEAVEMLGSRLTVHREALSYPTSNPEWNAMRQTIAALQPGGWAEPSPGPGGFRFLQLVDKVQGPVSFESLAPEQRSNLQSGAWQMLRDQRLGQYTDSLQQAMQPQVFAENLRRVPWPPPQPVDVGR